MTPAAPADSRPTPTRLAVWFALILLVVYLMTLGGGWQGIYSAPLRLASLILIALGLTVWGVAAALKPFWRPNTVLWPAFLVALTTFVLGFALSQTPRLGADYVAYAAFLTALYLVLQRLLAHAFFRVRLLGLCVVMLVALAGWYVLAVLLDWIKWWGLVGRIATPPLRPNFESLTYGNPSAVMTICLLLLSTSVAYVGLATPRRRVACLLLTGLALFVTLLTGSRAGWLGLAIGLAISVGLWFAVASNRRLVSRALSDWRLRAGAGVVLVVGAASALVFAPGILLRAGSGGEDLRATYFAAAVRMFQSAPIIGTGPGTWVPQRTEFTLATEPDYYIPHAHSIYFQTLAEFGLGGVFAGILVVGFLAVLIRRAVLSPDPVRRRFGWAALFSTAYFGAHQLLDFYPNMPAALFAFVVPIAWLDATAERSPLASLVGRLNIRRPGPGKALAVLGIASLVMASGWLWRSESAASAMNEGVARANDGDWAGALTWLEQAAAADPDMPPYQFALGVAAANVGREAEAATALEREVAVDDLPVGWLNLASVRYAMGDLAGTRDALAHAMRLGTQQPAINMGAGALFLELGDRAAAVESFGLAVQQIPSLAGDPWWQSTAALAAVWPDVLAGAIGNSTAAGAFAITLSAGRLGDAEQFANAVPDAGARAQLLNVLRAWGGDQVALAAIYADTLARPLDLTALGWAAALAARSGDRSRTDSLGVWQDTVNGGAGNGGLNIRVGPASDPGATAGVADEFYGHYTYRRPTPWDHLVARLPHLRFEAGP